MILKKTNKLSKDNEKIEMIPISQSNCWPNAQIIKKIFVPKTCLQGSELPIHLLWSKDKDVAIQIDIPNKFKFLRLNNVTDYIVKENILYVRRFEENGYIGLILKTNEISESSQYEKIYFKIVDSEGNIQTEIKEVYIFRPYIEIISKPEIIKVKKDEVRKSVIVEPKIKIVNTGEAIAVIRFDVCNNSDIAIEEPNNSNLFQQNFLQDIIKEFDELKINFNEYSSEIDKLIYIVKNPILMLNKKDVDELKDWAEQFDKILQSDMQFHEDFEGCIKAAYLKNINILVNVENFITYLKSIESNKIILQNPISVMKVGKEPKKFRSKLKIMDLGYNIYTPLDVEFEIVSDDDTEVPIHMLINSDISG